MPVETLSGSTQVRLSSTRGLPSPAALRAASPLDEAAASTVRAARAGAADILRGVDDRLLVVVGPCSIHDPDAARDYGDRLARLATEFGDELLVIMRAYVEKPRTALGWQGLVNDPALDGGQDIARGIATARGVLRGLVGAGMPVATELVDPLVAHYLTDLVSWAAIGARTAQSPAHRQLCSALDLPVGVKNTTSGAISPAVDAVRVAACPQVFTGIDEHGRAAVLTGAGNPDCHLVLRGGDDGPNHHPVDVAAAVALLRARGCVARLMIDASHGNSGKDHRRQETLVEELAGRIGAGEHGIAGVMIESFLVEGCQELALSGERATLTYGQSVTDACSGFPATAELLRALAAAVRHRRHLSDPRYRAVPG